MTKRKRPSYFGVVLIWLLVVIAFLVVRSYVGMVINEDLHESREVR